MSAESLITGFLGLVLVIALIFKYALGSKSLNIPGPKSLPIVGNILQIDRDKPHLSFMSFAETFGDIYKLRLFSTNIVVVSNEDYIKEVLSKNGAEFAGRPQTFRFHLMFEQRENVTFGEGKNWSFLKKSVLRAMKVYNNGLLELESVTNAVGQDFIKVIESFEGKPFDIKEQIIRCITNIMASLMFAKKFDWNDPNITRYVEGESKGYNASISPKGSILDSFPFFHKLNIPSSICNDIKQCIDSRRSFLEPELRELIRSYQPDKARGIGDLLYKFFLEDCKAEGKPFNFDLFFITVGDLFAASFATTSETIYSFILVLCNRKEIKQKIQKEVDEVLGTRIPTLADKETMPYLSACILELLRFISHVPILIPHRAVEDTKLGSYDIPKDTHIYINNFTYSHSEKIWDDPWNFIPERFLSENGDIIPANHPNRTKFFPFSSGKRHCPGEVLAKNRIFLLFCWLVQSYNFEFAEGFEITDDPRIREYGVILSSRPFKVVTTKRQSSK
ncbi:unnamed protein product [Dimorphilus gyrociliatus]|uniref:Uncharacterized protein n=1 Tax=Dimorphilus gyrociliatus TaxID=2664684 RepID=A0A7I8VBC0_9ANNE|nr:unnamed protein product [Dimorphilus gyrociliatus]